MSDKMMKIPDNYLDRVRRNGGRITPIVTAILQCLHSSKRIYSPAQIKDELKEILGCDICFPTIYRAIDRLLQCRLLFRMHRDDGHTAFFLCRHPDDEHHHHFICTGCDKVFEIEMCSALEYEHHVSQNLGAQITKHIIQLEGTCRTCLSIEAKKGDKNE